MLLAGAHDVSLLHVDYTLFHGLKINIMFVLCTWTFFGGQVLQDTAMLIVRE